MKSVNMGDYKDANGEFYYDVRATSGLLMHDLY